jgi:hypothetical protein
MLTTSKRTPKKLQFMQTYKSIWVVLFGFILLVFATTSFVRVEAGTGSGECRADYGRVTGSNDYVLVAFDEGVEPPTAGGSAGPSGSLSSQIVCGSDVPSNPVVALAFWSSRGTVTAPTTFYFLSPDQSAVASDPNSFNFQSANGDKKVVQLSGGRLLTLSNSGNATDVDDPASLFGIVQSNRATVIDPPGGTADETLDEDENCENNAGSLGWIMCPVLYLVDGVVGALDSQIQSLLKVNEERYRNPKLKEAWASMRNIALIILVPAALIMVLATALGFDFVSAYTVKKALPRFIIAGMFILVSWEITGFLITFFTNIGVGMKGLILAPFDIEGTGLTAVFDPNAAQAVGQWSFLAFLGIGILFSSAVLAIVLSFLSSAGLILLLVFLVLVAREMLILALMVVAPLAILAWIFPANTGLWRSWWGLFYKLLLLYPIIMALTAIGMAFAWMLGPGTPESTGGSAAEGIADLLNPLMKLAAYIIPYAIIPLTFKYVGGVLGNLAGMVNDKEKGLLDRQKIKRQENYGRAWRGAKSGEFLDRKNPFKKPVNRATSAIVAGPKAWMRKGGIESSRVMAGNMDAAHIRENDPTYKLNEHDEKYNQALIDRGIDNSAAEKARLRAIEGDTNRPDEERRDARVRLQGEARTKRDELMKKSDAFLEVANDTNKPDEERAKAKVDAMNARQQAGQWDMAIANAANTKGGANAVLAATQNGGSMKYVLSQGQEGYNQLANAVASAVGAVLEKDSEGNVLGAVGGNTAAFANAMNGAQFNLKNAGRFDLAGINDGRGYDPAKGVAKADIFTLGRSTPESVDAIGDIIKQSLAEARNLQSSGDTVGANAAFERASAYRQELDSVAQSAVGAVQQKAVKLKTEFTDPGSLPDADPAKLPEMVQRARVIKSWEDTPVSGGQTRKIRDNYTPGAQGWTPEERSRGWKIKEVPITNRDIAASKARTSRIPREDEQ